MVLNRYRDDMNIGFEARAQDAFRISIPGASIEREILRADLQHLPVVLEAHPRPKLNGIPEIVRLDLAAPPELIEAAAVYSGNRTADADNGGFRRDLRAQFSFVQSESNALRERFRICKTRTVPGVHRGNAISDEPQTVVFERADYYARTGTAEVKPYGKLGFSAHACHLLMQ
jgi:hypothetical protein